MAEIPFPPVDYSSRDYASLRQDMLDGIASRVPEWTSRNQNDLGIALIELFAYMGDGLHYYADRIANEAVLTTATQRRSVLNHAKLLDYRPRDNVAASVALVFSNAGSSAALIPAGTRVSTTSNTASTTPTVYFETTADLTVAAGSSSTVTATEGVTVASEQIGISTGVLDQDFPLFNSPVIEGSVTVAVAEGAAPTTWTYLTHLIDASFDSRAYSLSTDDRGITHVLFGDGANGRIPSVGAVARASYRVGGGSQGNVGPGQLTRIVTTVPAGVTVTNQDPAVGGADAETLAEIKVNAPRSLYTLNRAVTLTDYANLAVQTPSTAKAQTIAYTANQVTIYVAPTGGGGYQVDGVTPTTQLTKAQNDVQQFLADKIAPGVTLTVTGPNYVAVNLTLTVHVRPEFRQETVRQYLLKSFGDLFAFDTVVFGDRITAGDIFSILADTPGVVYGEGLSLQRTSGTNPEPTSPDAVMQLFEIPKQGTVTLNMIGGIPG